MIDIYFCVKLWDLASVSCVTVPAQKLAFGLTKCCMKRERTEALLVCIIVVKPSLNLESKAESV